MSALAKRFGGDTDPVRVQRCSAGSCPGRADARVICPQMLCRITPLPDGARWWRWSRPPLAAFCDELKQAGQQVLAADNPADEPDPAEGFAYLTRLLRLGLEKHVEFGDPVSPQFYSSPTRPPRSATTTRQLLSQLRGGWQPGLPDQGNRGSVAYLSIEQGRFFHRRWRYGTDRPCGDGCAGGAANGDFELLVAPGKAGNWLPMARHRIISWCDRRSGSGPGSRRSCA